MDLRAFVLVGIAVTAPAARGGPATVQDDFESGALLQPSGVWSQLTTQPDASIGLSAAAAHRGDAGLRVVDNDTSAGSGIEAALFFDAGTGSAGSYYWRGWFRLTSSSGAGTTDFVTLQARPSVTYAVAAVQLKGGSVALSGHDTNTVLSSTDAGSTLLDGAWHLVELGVTGVGADGGGRALWVDGALAAQQGGIDFSGESVQLVGVGEPWAQDLSFSGIIDFDDVRASLSAPASAIGVATDAGSGAPGGCVPMAVCLWDSSGNPAPAPYDVAAQTTSSQGGTYGESTCSSPLQVVTVGAGLACAPFWLKPTAFGQATLAASHPDFVSVGPLALNITDDAFVNPAFQSITPGQSATLDASGSHAADGGAPLTFVWTQTTGPSGVSLAQNQPRQSFTLTAPGQYTFTVSAIYAAGRTASAQAVVQVTGQPPVPDVRLGCSAAPLGTGAWLAALALAGAALRHCRKKGWG